MAIRFRCQSCSGLMSISSRMAGSVVRCPTCGELTPVPAEDLFESPPQPQEEPGLEPALEANEPAMPASRLAARAIEVTVQEDADDGGDVAGESPGAGDEEAPALQLRRRAAIDDEMDLTPMVDVTFQLLIFFMVTASFALQKSIEVPTPDPDKKGASQQLQILEDLEGSSIRVEIDSASAILVDDEPVADPARLADVLKDKMRKEQKTEVLITAHAAALHRSVITVIDAANHVGMQKIRLVSRQGKSD